MRKGIRKRAGSNVDIINSLSLSNLSIRVEIIRNSLSRLNPCRDHDDGDDDDDNGDDTPYSFPLYEYEMTGVGRICHSVAVSGRRDERFRYRLILVPHLDLYLLPCYIQQIQCSIVNNPTKPWALGQVR